MGIVYVVQEPVKKDRMTGRMVSAFDLTPATQFGELQFLLPPGKIMLTPAPTIQALRSGLRNYSDDDYLLPTGDPVSIMAAGSIAAEYNRGNVAILKWDQRHQLYQVVRFNLYGRPYEAMPVKNDARALP